jgi:hypothetical protein
MYGHNYGSWREAGEMGGAWYLQKAQLLVIQYDSGKCVVMVLKEFSFVHLQCFTDVCSWISKGKGFEVT